MNERPSSETTGKEIVLQIIDEVRRFRDAIPTSRHLRGDVDEFCDKILALLAYDGNPFVPARVWADALAARASELYGRTMLLSHREMKLDERERRIAEREEETRQRKASIIELEAIVQEMLEAPDDALRYRVEALRELLHQKERPITFDSFQIVAMSAPVSASPPGPTDPMYIGPRYP